MRALLETLDNPDDGFRTILVAGTKGKGSTAAMAGSVLTAAGLRVGRYTQPHLVSWRERTWVNGQYIEPDEVVDLLGPVRKGVDRLRSETPELGTPTTFEVGTAVSLLYFARQSVDVAVVEAGIGGAHDATNALEPIASAITSVSLDHAAVIGPELSDVAREKSGVLRPSRPSVIAPQTLEVLRILDAESKRVGAATSQVGREWHWRPTSLATSADGQRRNIGARPIDVSGPSIAWSALEIPLIGEFQRDNATTAIATCVAANLVPLDRLRKAVQPGLQTVRWPGRIQVVSQSPLVILDGAHNADSAARVAEALQDCFEFQRLSLVIGMSSDKDVDGFLQSLVPIANEVICTRARHERSLPEVLLADHVRRAVRSGAGLHVQAVGDPSKAMAVALASAGTRDAVCLVGSLFLVGQVLEQELPLPDSSRLASQQ